MLLGARQFFERRGTPTPPLPYDAEVEYLESTGTQWIDTGRPIPADFWFDATIDITGTHSQYKTLLGARIGSGVNDYQFSFQGTNNYFLARYGTNNSQYFAPCQTGMTRIRVESGGKLYINESYVTQLGVDSPSAILNMYIFALNNNGVVSQLAQYIRLYSLKYGGANESHDLIPVRFTNELGQAEGAMYDRVSGQLFRNQGTGTFIIGRDINQISARSYVNDGLVAMWDGIENAGWGTHDSSATMWKDLVGNNDASVSSGSFGPKGFSGVASASRPLSSDATFEVVATFNATEAMYLVSCRDSTGGYYILTNTSQGNCRYRYGISRDGSNFWFPSFIVAEIGTPFYYSFSGDAATGVKFAYHNGVRTQSSGGQTGFANGTAPISLGNAKATLYSVRLYSRALTSAEIAANYAIDKARFNLP